MNNLIREELDDKFGIVSLQNAILNIAQYVDTFCEKNDIEYCLMGGSALGAIRHHGFIPWDDDLDVFMTPDNYEKFRKAFSAYGDKRKYYLQELGASKGMVTTAKIRLNESTYVEDIVKDWDIHHGIYVDIFILHICPNLKIKRYWQFVWAKYVIVKGLANKTYERRSGFWNTLVKCFKMLPKRFLLNFGLRQVYRFRNEKTNYYCNYLGKALMKNGTYKASYFLGVKKVPFEKIQLNVPIKVEDFLIDRFGNYMKIPSEDRIRYEQHALEWSLDKPFKGYNSEGVYKDEKYLF